MSTYAISDIHGAYDEFQRLLDKIRFQYDGSDSLYLLGDFGDWGEMSMETIQLVRQMDQDYDFVHCIMGNHELMFLAAIEYGIRGDLVSESAENWLVGNCGLVTWNAYVRLPRREQRAIHRWLKSLPFSAETEIEGRRIMLAHAYPYYYDMNYTPEQQQRHKIDAVWRRLQLREDPFAGYRGEKQYAMLICGHTITDHYFQEVRLEESLSVVNALPPGKNRIFRGHKFIDIDCGAKCFDLVKSEDPVERNAGLRAQLAAYCLERDEEIYVARPGSTMGEMMNGEVVPDLTVPEVDFRSRKEPERSSPERKIPGLERSAVEYPDVRAPEVRIPESRSHGKLLRRVRKKMRKELRVTEEGQSAEDRK